MSPFTRALAATLAVVVALGRPHRSSAQAQDAVDSPRLALGFQLDLFPTVVSATQGELGLAPQVWLGVDHVRLRLLVAHLALPNAFVGAGDGFRKPALTAYAAIFDYTFGDDFDGPWVCAGLELWRRTIEHRDVEGRAAWTDAIATMGGGYIVRLAEWLYVDPWAGVHWTIDPERVELGANRYEPPRLAANASVKVGAFVDL